MSSRGLASQKPAAEDLTAEAPNVAELDAAGCAPQGMAAQEQVVRTPAQLAQLLIGVRRQRGLSQAALAQKTGGLSQARLSALELNPGRFTLERLLLILAALDLELVVRPRRRAPESAEW
jgi:HTH-type transcriptional regulator/antitoxin HipB